MNRLVLFAKYPEAGKVKTRLARRVGLERAAVLYKEMVEEVVRKTTPSNDAYQRSLYYDPPEARDAFAAWLPIENLSAQHGDDLGARLHYAIAELLLEAERVVVIGTDCVDLDRDLIETAFGKLADCDLVLGPAEDGGYYLIACREMHPELFQGITWSTDQVLAQTLDRANRLQLRVELLPVLADIDF